jgi:hypothetical protein
VIFGVLAQVALGSGGRDPHFYLGHALVLELVDLGLQLVIAGPGHGNAFGHGSTWIGVRCGATKNGLPWAETFTNDLLLNSQNRL